MPWQHPQSHWNLFQYVDDSHVYLFVNQEEFPHAKHYRKTLMRKHSIYAQSFYAEYSIYSSSLKMYLRRPLGRIKYTDLCINNQCIYYILRIHAHKHIQEPILIKFCPHKAASQRHAIRDKPTRESHLPQL